MGLYRSVSAMISNQRRSENIASNLANISTTGFKRRGAVNNSFRIGLPELGYTGVNTVARTDFSQGNIERTGNQLDLALYGDGFFAVEGPQGEVYTRNGTLQLNARGALTTLEGYPVAWDGSRREIDTARGILKIDISGYVSQGGENIGRLKIVAFPAQDRLQPAESGYWHADAALAMTDSTAEVHQGALERANVSPVDELVGLISVQRDFEAAANLFKLISDSYERLTTSG